MNNIIQAEIPEQLCRQVEELIEQGRANNLQEIINEVLRRYLESHQDVLSRTAVQEDVEWGLYCDG